MVAFSPGPLEASRSKGAVSGATAFRGGKTLARSVQFRRAEVQLMGHDGGPDLRASHFSGYFARITTHCTGAAGPRGFQLPTHSRRPGEWERYAADNDAAI
jgi:hypothetical protein